MRAAGVDLSGVPATPGAYVMLDRGDRPLYVGRAGDLRQRVRSYWNPSLDRPGLRGMVRRVRRIVTVPAASEHEAAFIERALLESHDPPFNRTLGFESVVAIRMTETSLTTVHEFGPDDGARYFGPYLGWSPVSAAQRALARAFPVHLCRPTGELTSVERDLASRRGLHDGAGAGLRAALVAALERDATAIAAVVARTEAARERASELGLYEQAAVHQSEIAGLRWVAQPQSAAAFDGAGGWRVAAELPSF
jgi:excinuclease ABC subunit C